MKIEKIYFVTANQHKLQEAQSILPQIEQLKMELDEIQSLNPEIVAHHKLQQALQHHKGPLLVEDTSVYFKGLNRFPGPLAKWMIESLELQGVCDLATQISTPEVEIESLIGWSLDGEDFRFFKGKVSGRIGHPKGEFGFGYDQIFYPDGFSVSYGELSDKEKSEISMRGKAFRLLKLFLEKENLLKI